MAHCHHCGTKLKAPGARCVACDGAVSSARTATERELAALGLASSEPLGGTDANRTVLYDELHAAATVSVLGSIAQADQTVTSQDVDPARLVESTQERTSSAATPATHPDQEAAADLTDVNRIWGGSFTENDTPLTSLKSQTPATELPENAFHVAPRVLRGAGGKPSTPVDYELLERVGEGAMGQVFKARQAAIDRIVAVKTLKPSSAHDKRQRDKFLAEAGVTGELDHPNIVPIYDLGTSETGALFYSMKMVQGKRWLDELPKRSLQANLEVLMKVADAVAFAHSRGVVHRDLKPENVMLGEFGEVLVMDWGLAIFTSGARRPGGVSPPLSRGGTPAYMAPEMAAGPLDRIGPASDIYLLGAILFEIITGKPPHAGPEVLKCLQAAAKNQIQPVNEQGELLDVARRAMSTEPRRRPPTVTVFQESIREYLSHSESSVLSSRAEDDLHRARQTNDYQDYAEARFGFQKALEMWRGNARAKSGLSEASAAYAASALGKGDFDLGLSLLDRDNSRHGSLAAQLREAQEVRAAHLQRLKTLRRALVGGVALFFVAALGALGVVAYLGLAANEARQVAEQAEGQAKAQFDAAQIARQDAETAEEKARREKDAADIARASAEVSEGRAKTEKQAAVEARSLAEYQEYIAVIGLAQTKIDENAHGRARQLLERYADRPDLIHWEWGRLMRLCNQAVTDFRSPDKERIEALALDERSGQFATGGWNGRAYVWKLKGGTPIVLDSHGTRVSAVAFSPTEDLLVTGSDYKPGYIQLWRASTGQPVANNPAEFGFEGHTGPVLSLMFSRDGRRLLSSSADGTARVWNVAERTLLQTFKGHIDPVHAAVYSPQEDRIATVSDDGTALIWNVATGRKSDPFYGHQGPVYAAAFSPDGSRVATGGYDKRVLVWNPAEIKPFDYQRHAQEFKKQQAELESKPDQTTTTGNSPKLRMRLEQKVANLVAHTDRVQAIRFSADGNLLFSAGHDNAINVWDARRAESEGSKCLLKTLRGHNSPIRACATTKDGGLVLSGGYDGVVKLWDVRKYEEVRVLIGAGPQHAEEVLAASFAGAGDQLRIVTASHDRTAKVWRLQHGAAPTEEQRFVEERTLVEGHNFLASQAVFLDDGGKLLTGGIDQSARIWDVATGTQLRQLKGTGGSAVAAVSPDGQWILTGDNGHAALLWNAAVEEPPVTLAGHRAPVSAVAFSPSGDLFFTGDKNGRGRVWDARTRKPVGADLTQHAAAISGAAFLPDGRHLLTASGDNHVGHWDLSVSPAVRLPKLTLAHPKGVKSLAVTSDGKYALTSCEDNQVRLWNVALATVVRRVAVPGTGRDGRSSIGSVTFSNDNLRAMFVADEDRSVREFLVDSPPAEAPRLLLSLGEQGGYVRSAIYTPDDAGLLTVGGNDARLWEARPAPGRLAGERMRFGPHDVVASASFSPDRQRVVTAGWDFSARIWSVESGRDELQLKGHTDHVNSALFSPDGRLVLTSSDDGTARVWCAVTGRELLRYPVVPGNLGEASGSVRWASFSNQDGGLVATASSDFAVRLWPVELPADLAEVKQPRVVDKPAGELLGHEAEALHVVFSHDNTRLASGSRDNTARIWDVRTRQSLQSLVGHRADVNSVAFSPDGKRLLTGSDDFTAKLWDVVTGQEVLNLKGHEREVTSVAFSSDGLYALTGSRDSKAIVWTANDWKVRGSRIPGG